MLDSLSFKKSTRRYRDYHTISLALIFLVVLLSGATSAVAQTSQRWFQIEVSIFSNEAFADRDEESWDAAHTSLSYPSELRRLRELSDLLVSQDMIDVQTLNEAPAADTSLVIEEQAAIELDAEALEAAEQAALLAEVLATGPLPPREASDFKFFDLLRDPDIHLSPQDSDFQQTNRALERSSDHRLLFHGLWRESLADADEAIPLYIQGGLKYADQYELQGNITLRFNENRDRIVIDTDLWLTEFSASAELDSEWQLPETPRSVRSPLETLIADDSTLRYGINRIFTMRQSREMRSTEFHYLDHPAMGVVILVEPYDIPELPLSGDELN